MEKILTDFLILIRNYVSDYDASFSLNDKELEALGELAHFHNIDSLVLEAFKKNNLTISEDFSKNAKRESYKSMAQEEELEVLKRRFIEEKIPFMPLKGAVISKMYPKSYLRNRADIDILVKLDDFKKVKEILLSEGYSFGVSGSNHDSYNKGALIKIEIHKSLIDEAISTHSFFSNVWDSDYIYNDGYEYFLKEEYFYMFLLSHSAKHFSNGGGAFRLLIDLYYYFKFLNNNGKSLDFDLINEKLEELGLAKFNKIVLESVDYLFNGKEETEDILLFLDYILKAGTYGTKQINSMIGIDQEGSKGKHILKRLFPPLSIMKRRNPTLKKAPFLLPWFYFTRCIKGLFRFKATKEELKSIDDAKKYDKERLNKIKDITGLG